VFGWFGATSMSAVLLPGQRACKTPPMHTLRRDTVTLAYEESGTGDPPFVFVHGWTCNHTHFAPQVAHFTPRHRVVAVDLRGHGASDSPVQEYTVTAFADDVAWLCEQLELTHPILVGHSMGATVVLDVAARYPELPAAVVMLDAAPIVGASPSVAMAAELAAALSGPDGPAARAALIEHAASGFARDPALQARVRDDMSAAPDHVALSCIANLGQWDGEGAARACRVPALHIAADDPINDAAALRALNPLLRTGQTVGAGHFNQLEVPDQVNTMIERFLVVAVS
jgi:pimeloyl-ACP methyl ester carboxylesterase